MKKLYYAGLALEKDLEFCEILKEVKKTKGVYVLAEPEQFEVIEMKYKNAFNSEREETGKKHIGYDYHYITFLYNGIIFTVDSSTYYPFTDTNYPGKWNFRAYRLITPSTKTQGTYNIKYEGFDSIEKYIERNKAVKTLRGCNPQKIDIYIHSGIESQVKQIVRTYGGYREKEIYNNGCFFDRSETWNNEHKVINVLSIFPDADGYRSGFAVDIVTNSICG